MVSREDPFVRALGTGRGLRSADAASAERARLTPAERDAADAAARQQAEYERYLQDERDRDRAKAQLAAQRRARFQTALSELAAPGTVWAPADLRAALKRALPAEDHDHGLMQAMLLGECGDGGMLALTDRLHIYRR